MMQDSVLHCSCMIHLARQQPGTTVTSSQTVRHQCHFRICIGKEGMRIRCDFSAIFSRPHLLGLHFKHFVMPRKLDAIREGKLSLDFSGILSCCRFSAAGGFTHHLVTFLPPAGERACWRSSPPSCQNVRVVRDPATHESSPSSAAALRFPAADAPSANCMPCTIHVL